MSGRIALDRHWRNARTVHSHNPAAQRRRAIGDFELNGRRPVWRGAAAALTEDAATPDDDATQPKEND
ncbi:hypothetical protein [Microbacterium sp. NIBRBAC000506063]|uniref:hypothetical protein n=1 Tax=Microbacterium sp. NIBRBAC000506063 TaxID=2734618 RepID=UPI001BB7748D|nr:hypothetical protein [Microbacterium sp. NIBRBAC000506063]QTV79146.1 hypothetical protein KAE78_08605 [Microbacterium sp. NIBRBAC000506063]